MTRRIWRGVAVVAALTVVGCAAAPGGLGRGALRERLVGPEATPALGSVDASGLALQSLQSGGMERSYYVHVPPGLSGVQGVPAVFVFHGGEGDGTDAASISGMAQAADAGGFVAVFPNSAGTQWNDGRETTASGIDDVGFTLDVLDDVAARFGVDPTRAFAAGMSNGGMFTQRLACDAAGSFRAYAVAAANMPRALSATCAPSRPVPIVFFSGTADRLMPFDGGEVGAARRIGAGAGGAVLSFAQTQDFWARVNGCGSEGPAQALPDRADDGTRVEREDRACTGGSELEAFVVEGGGHSWPGSANPPGRLAARVIGATTQDLSATAEIVAFFRRFGL